METPPPFDQPIPAATAHVWTADLAAIRESQFATLAAHLAPDECARAGRFHFERDRRHFTAARGWLRDLLARYLGTAPAEIRFDYGLRGKPFLVSSASTLRFNLSHSHGRALFVFAQDREVGIDVETGARLGDDWPGLVRRVFSAREQAEFAALPPPVRRTVFLDGWTRKEAYLKATGLGIVDGLQSIEITLDPARPPALLAAPSGLDWTLYDLRTDADFAAALVIGGMDAVTIRRFDCPSSFHGDLFRVA